MLKRPGVGSFAGRFKSVLALAVLVGCGETGTDGGGSAAERPSIVLIIADDLGYHDLGSYGQDLIVTPNLDRLAAEGIRFTDFYAGSPVCAPSRSVLWTGLHAGHTPVRANYARAGGLRQPPGTTGPPGHPRVGLGENDVTIGDVMRRAGYVTGYFGKWHLSGYDPGNLPVRRGFDEYRGSDMAVPGSQAAGMEMDGADVVPVREAYRSDYRDDTRTSNAIDFIERHARRPFFVVLSLTSPHRPFEIPHQGLYANRPWSEMARNYAAMITRLDEHVGSVLDALEAAGIHENTLVVFISDNGGEYRNHGGNDIDHSFDDWAAWTRLFRSNHPLRGGKADLYEGGIRVPAIMRWPARVGPGQVDSHPWHFVDLMPTFAAAGGGRAPSNSDGMDMFEVLLGPAEYPGDRYLYWEFDHQSFAQAIRWQDWKLIRWSTHRKRIYGERSPSDERRSEVYPLLELYDLVNDIGEERNVVEEHPAVLEFMLDLLEGARTDSPHWPLTEEEANGLWRSVIPDSGAE